MRFYALKLLKFSVFSFVFLFSPFLFAGDQEDFLCAAREGDLLLVQQLVSQVDVNVSSSTNKRTALSYAAESSRNDVVFFLIQQRDIDLDRPDTNGKTPLMWAAQKGSQPVVAALLEAKADSTLQSRTLKTALNWATNAEIKALLSSSATEVPSILPASGEQALIETSLDASSFSRSSPSSSYLYLEPEASLPRVDGSTLRYIISMPPVNSSGDIYHVVSFILASLHERCAVPLVQLFYDTEKELTGLGQDLNTLTQVNRSIQFAQDLGLEDFFLKPCYLESNGSYRPKGRKARVDAFFKEEDSYCYLDQKATTTLLARYFEDHPDAGETLRDQYQLRLKEYLKRNPVEAEKISSRLESYLKKIQNVTQNSNSPMVLIRLRHSGHANNQQNLKEGFILELSKYLQKKGYSIFYLLVDSRLQKSFPEMNKTVCVSPFYDSQEKEKDSVDFGKMLDLALLLELRQDPKIHGIIGNTSGTLDLAAFIGHRVYNIHLFSYPKLVYQDCRILIQTSFMSVEDYLKVKDFLEQERKRGERRADLLEAPPSSIDTWLQQRSTCPKLSLKLETTSYHQFGFCDLFDLVYWDPEKRQCLLAISRRLIQTRVLPSLEASENPRGSDSGLSLEGAI